MAWTTDFSDFDEARERARKAMSLPIGLTSPLWMAFGVAAGAGVAWWWATRWTRAVNLEAMAGAAKAQVEVMEAIVEHESEVATGAVEAAEAVLTAAAILESRGPVETPIVEPSGDGDDLTRLAGVGPKLAAALNAHGVTSFAQLAAWTDDHAAAFDAELSLKGRVARDAWVAQARRLASNA